MTDIPQKARKAYEDAVEVIKESVSRRRADTTSEVIALLKEAVREHPKYFEAWRLLGEIYLGTDESVLGYLALRRAHYVREEDDAVKTLLAEAALMLDRPRLALEYLSKVKVGDEAPLAVKKLAAAAYARVGMWDDALRAFGEALAEDPSDGDLCRECASVLSELGYVREAASVLADYLDPFRDFIDNQPAVVETGWIMPYGTVLDRLAAGARKKVPRREVVANAEDYRAWYALGNTFLDGEIWAAAVACYKRALRVHPDYYDALHNMGIALEELGRAEEALQMYEAAVETSPEEAEAYLSIAELLEDIAPEDVDEITLNYLMYYEREPEAEGFEELEEKLVEHLESNPDIAQVLLMARIYLLRGEVEKAERMLGRIGSAGSDESNLQLLRGQVLYELGRVEEAEDAFRKGLKDVRRVDMDGEVEPEDIEPEIRLCLAELLDETGRRLEAEKVLKEAEDILNPDGLSLLAELMAETRPAEAEKCWNAALAIDPEHVPSLVGLANRRIDQKKLEDAIVLLERAFKVDPEDEEVVARLAELYPEIGAPELVPENEEQEGAFSNEEETG